MSQEQLLQRITALEKLVNSTQLRLDTHVDVNASVQDTSWVIITATLIVFMQLGFAMLEAGSVRSHNAIATYAKNMLDFVHGSVVAVIISFWVAYRVHPIAHGSSIVAGTLFRQFYHYLTFQATTATIVSGAMAERVRLSSYLAICTIVSGFIFPFAVWCTWGGGWLAQLNPPFHDFAGSGVVHMVGGICGLCGCLAIGSREGRWEPETASDFRPHNVMSVLSGVLILWVGWYGFNCGSTAAMSVESDAFVASKVAINTTMSAAFSGACAVALASMQTRSGKVDILALANGILAGLVGITAGCDAVSVTGSVLIGAMSAIILLLSQAALDAMHIDDVVAAFPVHGACGLWGVVAVGFFHEDLGLFQAGKGELLLSQLIGVGVLALICTTLFVVVLPLRHLGLLRISKEEEEIGMDSMFGLNAYENHADFVARYHIVAELLVQAGASPSHLVNALGSLHDNIFRPFTPFAGDHRLQGEVADILEHVQYQASNHTSGGQKKRHLLFLSHYKATGGEAVRIFMDQARRQLAESKRPDVISALQAYEEHDLVYLDSVNLKDLNGLLDEVGASLNIVLFLTRNCLSRPWVLAELCKAYTDNINIILVKVENTPDKTFAFPKDVDKAISDWKWFARQKARTITQRLARYVPTLGRGGAQAHGGEDSVEKQRDQIQKAVTRSRMNNRRATNNLKQEFAEGEWGKEDSTHGGSKRKAKAAPKLKAPTVV